MKFQIMASSLRVASGICTRFTGTVIEPLSLRQISCSALFPHRYEMAQRLRLQQTIYQSNRWQGRSKLGLRFQ